MALLKTGSNEPAIHTTPLGKQKGGLYWQAFADLRTTMTHFTADDGEKIRIHVSGEGSPLIMLHGWTANHLEWSMFMRGLNPHCQVFRWDARCRGDHVPLTTTVPTVERMARDLQNMLDHFHLDQVAIVGHSMGALTLWQYLRDFGTKRVAKLCFIDQSPKLLTDKSWHLGIYGDFDSERSRQFIDQLRQNFPESVLRLVANGLNRRARMEYEASAPNWETYRRQLESQNPAPLIACWESLTQADYRDVLEHIDVPTLLIYGGESNFYLPETGRYVAERIPGAHLHIYDGEDHSPHMWQRERFLRDLLAFIG